MWEFYHVELTKNKDIIHIIAYNPSGKNQENQKLGTPNVKDAKCLKRGVCIYRRSFLKVGMAKKPVTRFSIGLSHSKCFLFDTFNIPINIYLAMTLFLHCKRTFCDSCNIWKVAVTVEKGYGFFWNLVLMHLNHFIQVFFIPVFANSLIEILTSTRGFYCCWAIKKRGTDGGEGSRGSIFSCSLKALQMQESA